MREPAVRGQFYPYSPAEITGLIEECYTSEFGPGSLPPVKVGPYDGRIKGALVPHAGFVFSGHAAAWVYRAIAKGGMPSSFVILGPNHRGFGSPVAVALDDYNMPSGKVRTDRRLARKLVGGPMVEDDMAHTYEHSLEVQLPFLQHLGREFKVVTIALTDQSRGTSVAIGDRLIDAGDGFIPIASSDLSHVGRNYGVAVPRGMNAGQLAREMDVHAIEAMKRLDVDELYRARKRYGITMCGYGAAAAVMRYARARGATKGKLLTYYSSHDIMPGDSAVGYGAMIFV